MHVLSPFPPLDMSVDDTAGGTQILAADDMLRTVQLTHVSGDAVWISHLLETPVAEKGFCLLPGGQLTFDHDSIPTGGLAGICKAGESATIAIGRA